MLETLSIRHYLKGENMMVETISREELADRAWLAGIIDGEGHMDLKKNKARRGYDLRVTINNTDPRMIQKISQIWERWSVKFYYQYLSRVNENRRDRMTVESIGYGSVQKILTNTLPYLTAKHEQAVCLLSFIAWRQGLGYTHVGPEKFVELHEKAEEVREEMKAFRHQEFNLQRLTRAASKALNLG